VQPFPQSNITEQTIRKALSETMDRPAALSLKFGFASVVVPLGWVITLLGLFHLANVQAVLALIAGLALCTALWFASMFYAVRALWKRDGAKFPSRAYILIVQLLLIFWNLPQLLVYASLISMALMPDNYLD
jgi:hypothetical protein